ncbi:MAG: hypothetical protein ACXWZM_03155 [Solirubrobacterales bacterium]
MLSWPLYRLMLLPALAAAVVLLFSVVSRPEPLRTDFAADSFDAARATVLARELQRQAPDRSPGGAGDRAAADSVLSHFREIEGGEVSAESFGDSLRNVSLVIPGESSERVVIAAPRDCGEGDCAVSSGAATAALVELAEAFGGVDHSKSIELVSLDGSSDGASGAGRLAASLDSEMAEAVIVIAAPASKDLSRPLVVPFSSGPQSTSIQLVESAERAVETELGVTDAFHEGTVSSLLRLAIPAGIGDQAPLIADGHDAITLTSAGELPLPASQDRPADLSTASLDGVGRATLALALALDASPGPLDHGPESYVPLAGKLIPGWAIALLAIALLAPVAVVSLDGLARASRRGEALLPAAAWLLSRMIPFFATALLAYLMAMVGLIPSPSFPFDPSRHGFGAGAAAASLVLIAAFGIMVHLARRLPLPQESSDAAAPVIGAALALASAGIWIANPFFALLLVPTVHLWLLAAAPEMRGRVATVIVLCAAGLVVPAIALVSLGSRLGVGLEVPWQLLLMFTGRHFGPLALAPLCLLGGCLLAVLTSAMTRPRAPATGHAGARVRGPLTYAGPGSLGGTESALPRR